MIFRHRPLSRLLAIFAISALLLPACSAASPQQAQKPAPKKAQTASKAEPAPRDPNHELGLQMLETAEAAAGGLEPDMRAYSLWQIARGTMKQDRAKSSRLLVSAFQAVAGRRDEDDAREIQEFLQERILLALMPISLEAVEELLPAATPDVRLRVTGMLANRYAELKDFPRALAVVRQISAEAEFPYDTAMPLLRSLPRQGYEAERSDLFAQAIASYAAHEHKGSSFSTDDFGEMLGRFWREMPPALALEGIRELLKQTRDASDAAGGFNIVLSSRRAGTASFASLYQYRLFQVLPALQQLDPNEAEKLLKENAQLQEVLKKNPDGYGAYTQPGEDPEGEGVQMMVNRGGGGPGPSGAEHAHMELMRQVGQIVRRAAQDPQGALAEARTLPEALPAPEFYPRAEAFQGIARTSAKSNPGVAKQALGELLKLVERLDARSQALTLHQAAELYLRLGDKPSAEKTIAAGLKAAEKLLAADTNADNPNRALKAHWPSAAAYRMFVTLAAQISPLKASQMIAEIDDPEIQVVQTIAVGSALLGAPPAALVMQVRGADGRNFMMQMDEGEGEGEGESQVQREQRRN